MTNPLSIVHCTESHVYEYLYVIILLLTSLTWFTLAPDESSSLKVSVRPFLAASMSAVSPFYRDRVSINRV